MRPTPYDYARGALYGLAAVCIWAAFIVVSRLGVTLLLAVRFASPASAQFAPGQ